jgi:hypothetical protein
MDTTPTRIRDDATRPVLQLQTEAEVALDLEWLQPGLGSWADVRQPDAGNVHTWEVAGASHADTYLLGAAGTSTGLDISGLMAVLWPRPVGQQRPVPPRRQRGVRRPGALGRRHPTARHAADRDRRRGDPAGRGRQRPRRAPPARHRRRRRPPRGRHEPQHPARAVRLHLAVRPVHAPGPLRQHRRLRRGLHPAGRRRRRRRDHDGRRPRRGRPGGRAGAHLGPAPRRRALPTSPTSPVRPARVA